ncbi:hypothetical protein CLOSTHATH_01864 [Hungatella hathewayi DSM 13479]|uniref:Uncharacterized protein n=1 Tax=Hungatella hathewayi DSM 13479 TaxID=566550 RepID=D3AE35_9FIRM|nr:hypothetical protein CLOSTHATH_01864 [Hungatella hathewayi DSM 13479]
MYQKCGPVSQTPSSRPYFLLFLFTNRPECGILFLQTDSQSVMR